MAWLLLVLMSLNHWLVTPLLHLGEGLLELHWLGWLLLALGLWLFAGSAAPRLESGSPKPKSGAGPGLPRG
jgi:hypothetical protein